MSKRIYSFRAGAAEGDRTLKSLLGGKGAQLAEMSRLGVPVPPGFTLTTEVCTDFYDSNQTLPIGLQNEMDEALARLEKSVGRKFGDKKDPLLVSVRSGAAASMPGMMDTVLNIGLTPERVLAIAEATKDPRFAWDTYRRLIQMFADVVMGVPRELFEKVPETDLSVHMLQDVVEKYRGIVRRHTGRDFPDDPREQLNLAVEAVFRSWKTKRAIKYREIHGIPETWGTAVNVQSMVFGNRGEDSATGVVFTRNPGTGEDGMVGEYLINAQGEDVVAGIRTPQAINAKSRQKGGSGETLEEKMPSLYQGLAEIGRKLERHYGDMQDIEFTIEQGKLWILQTRNGKRTAQAAVRMGIEMVDEGIVDRREVLKRISATDLDQLLHPIFDPTAPRDVLAKGIPASPGAVTGKVVFCATEAEEWKKRGEKVILVRSETSPEDIHGMQVAEGILTSRGGMTSHAAVVARGMGKSCIVGCDEIDVDEGKKILLTHAGKKITEGTVISLDGATGEVLWGEVKKTAGVLGEEFARLMEWTDEFRKLKVRANADTPEDCRAAIRFGAQGIGLCRTEHMFFDKSRIDSVRLMILAETPEERAPHLKVIQEMQTSDFREIFRVMQGLPVTIRLLDPPLHEFLPAKREEVEDFAARVAGNADALEQRISELHEFNPMLGHRGCRLGITFPDVYEMQVRAIMNAACEVDKESDDGVRPEIMVPLVADPEEMAILREMIVRIAEEVKAKRKSSLRYVVGTMIELPRAALLAGEIAKNADFFSFGTNDLTQTTFGLSRDDSFRFIPEYAAKGIFQKDPFASLDSKGVAELMKIGTERGRETNPQLKVGICGEHGGDPESIFQFHRMGFNYISCSPYRIPVARLAAAQIALETMKAAAPGRTKTTQKGSNRATFAQL